MDKEVDLCIPIFCYLFMDIIVLHASSSPPHFTASPLVNFRTCFGSSHLAHSLILRSLLHASMLHLFEASLFSHASSSIASLLIIRWFTALLYRLMFVLHSSRTEIITSLKFHSSLLHFPRASLSASSPVSPAHFSSSSLVHIFHCFIRPCLIHCFSSFYFIGSPCLDHFLISRASLLHFSHPSLLHCSHVHCFTFLV